MVSNNFIPLSYKSTILDEDGENSGYDIYKLYLPKQYKNILKYVEISSERDDTKYRFRAVPIKNSPQTYFILPYKIKKNLLLGQQMRAISEISKNKTMIDKFIFWDGDNDMTVSRREILENLGFCQHGNDFILGYYKSEMGITKIELYFNDKTSINIPSGYSSLVEKIFINSWNLSLLYFLPQLFKNEKNINFRIGSGLNYINIKLLDSFILNGLIFKNKKIYDVYNLFDISNEANREAIIKLNKEINLTKDKIYSTYKSVGIDIDKNIERFKRFESEVYGRFLSPKYSNPLIDEEVRKKILRINFGFDYQ